jgi:hypothetical protein
MFVSPKMDRNPQQQACQFPSLVATKKRPESANLQGNLKAPNSACKLLMPDGSGVRALVDQVIDQRGAPWPAKATRARTGMISDQHARPLERRPNAAT